jgi:ABC-type phosphate/phosphonate transport system substrate-binding protein
MNKRPLLLGAVAYDAKVVPIWDGFRAHFEAHGLPFDYVLYTNYERQVDAHLRGEIDVAWNSPLAWLQAEAGATQLGKKARAVAMRDTDLDLTSVILVKKDAPINSLADLAGKKLGVGAADSPQATLIPLLEVAEAGVEPNRDVEVVRHDVLLGKHGDHIGGERDAIRALLSGNVDAAVVLDGNHLAFSRERLFALGELRVLHQTGLYDHCNFTVFDDAPESIARFVELLLGMSYADPNVRGLLDLEGLKKWCVGRTSGYERLARATTRFGTLEDWARSWPRE